MKSVRPFHGYVKLTGLPNAILNPSITAIPHPSETPPNNKLAQIPSKHQRPISLHFIPKRILNSAAISNSKASISVLDLEDSVPQHEKAETRTFFQSFLKSITKPENTRIVVRINPVSQSLDWLQDLCDLSIAQVSEFMVAKTENSEELSKVDEVLTKLEKEQGLPNQYFRLCAIIETPSGVMNVEKICQSNRVDSVVVGNHDLAERMGCGIESPAMYRSFKKIVGAARRANIDALGGSLTRIDAGGAFVKETKKLSGMGFSGRACMNKHQLTIVNQTFRRTPVHGSPKNLIELRHIAV